MILGPVLFDGRKEPTVLLLYIQGGPGGRGLQLFFESC